MASQFLKNQVAKSTQPENAGLASSFLRERAAVSQKRTDKAFENTAYGGSKFQFNIKPPEKKVDALTEILLSAAPPKNPLYAQRPKDNAFAARAYDNQQKYPLLAANTPNFDLGAVENNGRNLNVLSGAGKTYGASLVNGGGFLLDTTSFVNRRAGDYEGKIEAAEDNISRYQAQRQTADAMEQKRLDTLIERNRRVIALENQSAQRDSQYTTGAAKKLYGTADRLDASGRRDIAKAKDTTGKFGDVAIDIGVAGAQLAGDATVAALLGVPALVPMGARVFGGATQTARQNGASFGEQAAYGASSAALSVATERLLNISAPFRKMFGKGFLDDVVTNVTGKLGQSPAGKLALSALSEGGEEFLEDALQPILQRATYDPSAKFDLNNALYDALIGGVLGGIGGSADVLSGIGNTVTASAGRGAGAETANTVNPDTVTPDVNGPQSGGNAPPTELLQIMTDTVDKMKKPASEMETAQPTQKSKGDGTDALTKILLGGKRVDQSTLTPEQFDHAATLNEAGRVGMDAGGRVFSADPSQHIDHRTTENVAPRRVKAFQFDWPEVHPYYAQAAEDLLADADLSLRNGNNVRYERTMQGNKRISTIAESPFMREAMDGGLSRSEIIRAAQAIVDDHGQENFAAAKRLELVLDRMLTYGYTTLYDKTVEGNTDYLDAKSRIMGAEAQTASTGEELPIWDKMGTDGIGAADAGFDPYSALQNQTDRFYPEGANPARAVDVPTTDSAGNPISKSASTVLGAKAIPDDAARLIEQMIAEGRLSYQTNTDRASLTRARTTVANKGFDGALEQFRSAVQGGSASKDLMTLGQTLLSNAANSGDGNAVAEILSLYQAANTNVGQAMQAASIFRKLSPESQLYGIQKTVSALGDKLAKAKKSFPGVSIDSGLIEEFLAQGDQAGRDAVMRRIYKNVADQIPATWKEKWDAWRYLSMLGNTRTHVRNIAGNVGFQPMRIVKNEIAAVVETALSKAGVDVERTKSFGTSPALYRAAWNDYTNVKDALGGNKYDDAKNEIQQMRRIFKTGILEKARTGNSAALEMEDAIFKRVTYADSLAGFLKANGATAAQMETGTVDPVLLQRARDYAGREALKATYQDRNHLSDAVGKLKYRGDNPVIKAGSDLAEGVLPFKRTPANILVRAAEYSPVGLAKGLTRDLAKVKSGDMTAAEAIDDIASGLTGTGLGALGAYLFLSGIIRCGLGDDKDDKWAELLGHQGYALELPGGTSVTLDWMAPASLPFFIGAEFASAIGENGFQAQDIWTALSQMQEPMLEMSMLQSLNDLIESVSYDENKMGAMIASALVSYFNQAIPTISGQVERSSQETRTAPYTDKNNKFLPTDVQYALSKASAKIPGWDFQQMEYIDAWGRTEDSGDMATRTFNNLFNPAYVSNVSVDAVERELQRIRDKTGDTSVFPSNAARYFNVGEQRKDLTMEEYTKYAKTLGQTRYDLAAEGMKLSAYKAMNDSEKSEYIQRLYDYANATAKTTISTYTPEDWVQNAKTAKRDIGISTAEFLALYQQYGGGVLSSNSYEKTKRAVNAGLSVEQYAGLKGRLDGDGNGSISKSEAISALDGSGFPTGQKADIWDIIHYKNWGKKNPYA